MTGYYESGGEDPNDPNQPQASRGQRRVLGIVLLMVVVFTSAIAIYMGAVIIGGFFSIFIPLTGGLPTAVQTQIQGIPTADFISFDIMVGGVAIIAVIGIIRIIFGG